jgi:hypothetical protein
VNDHDRGTDYDGATHDDRGADDYVHPAGDYHGGASDHHH